MRRAWLASVAILLLVASVQAQRTRPEVGVSIGTEDTYAHASIQDDEIILYAVYNNTTGAIRAYAVWNNSESTATASIDFVTGDPLTFSVAPGTRSTLSVASRGYVMSDSEGRPIDQNVTGLHLGHSTAIRNPGPRGAFPLPTER